MHGRTWRLGAAIIGAVASLGWVSGSALAATPLCSDGFTDPSGDAKDTRLQIVNPNHVLDPVAIPGQDNEDLLGGTVTTGLDGNVTVTLKIANLSKTVPADATGVAWYYGYTIDGLAPEFVSASTDGTSYVFDYGHIDPKTGVYTTDGTATGNAVEGKDGTISIVLPDSFAGDTLTQTYATAFQETGVGSRAVVYASSLDPIDSAPDGGGEGGTNLPDCTV